VTAVAPGPSVLYIMGSGRSGSTILGSILGEVGGFVHVGELRSLWGEGLLHADGRVCGCGQPVAACDFWSEVVRRTDLPSIGADPAAVLGWQRREVRTRHTWRILRAHGPSRRPDLGEYAGVQARLYRAVGEVAGASVVVDSSKRPADAALLTRVPGITPYLVHLVRDPRAVAYSWQRMRTVPRARTRQRMTRWRSSRSTGNWLVANLTAEALRRRGATMLVRYEDLVEDPRATVAAIVRFVGADASDLPFEDERTVILSPNHTSGGNPVRFSSGRLLLRADDEWLEEQASVDRVGITAATLPLLVRYRYPIGAPPSQPILARAG
jgi:sulfotransferase family protein